MSCERSIRPLDRDTCAGTQSGHGRGVVTDAFHGETQEGRSRSCRDRERMGLPPHPLGEKAPLEELPACYGEAVEALPATDDRDRVRPLRAYLHNFKAV